MRSTLAALCTAVLCFVPACSNEDSAAGGAGGGSGTAGTSGGAGGSKAASGGETASGGTGGVAVDGAGGTGGVTGAGGSRGSSGSPPRDVLPCSALPTPGTWEEITPPGDVGGPVAISVDPFHAGALYVNMHKGGNGPHFPTDGLYRSPDCGATWLPRLNTGKNGDTAATGPWTSWIFDPAQEGVIYVAQIYGSGGVFKSTNGGVDWTQLLPETSEVAQVVENNHIDSISMDPHDHLHLVIGTHATCKAPYGPACEAETTDGGTSWRVVSLPLGGWEEGAGPWVLGGTSWVYAGPSGLRLTTDSGAHFSDVTAPGTSAYYGGESQIHPILQSNAGTYFLSSAQGIVKSDDGKAWSLIPDSGGRSVGLTMTQDALFSSDLWSPTLHTAPLSDVTRWTLLPSPPLPEGFGFAFLDYDQTHHVLYGSSDRTLWRLVTP